MRVVLANSGAYFHADGSIPQIMNGMPRACLTNALDISNLLFLILPPFPAYLLNYLFVHTIAFVGMFILLRSYCPCNGSLINAGISFAFGVLPFYSTEREIPYSSCLAIWQIPLFAPNHVVFRFWHIDHCNL